MKNQSGFSSTIGTNQGNFFAMADMEGNLSKCLMSIRILIRQIFDFNDTTHDLPPQNSG